MRLINEDITSIYSEKDTLLLTAFDVSNKYNGFFYTFLDKQKDPQLLSIKPHHIYTQDSQSQFPFSLKPLKASEARQMDSEMSISK